MLSKVNKLREKKDFEKLFKEGKSFKNSFLILKIAQNNLKENRFGFIISKKVSKKAFLRNKIKRRLKDIMRQNTKDIKKGINAVLIVIPGLEEKNFLETKEILNTLLKKAGLII